MRLVVVKLVTFFFFLVSVEALIDSICTPSVSYQYNLHHCIAHQCTVILVRASSDCVQHFAFVFVQTVRGSRSSCLKEVGSGSYYLKEVGSRSGRVENNACRCVPGGTSRGTAIEIRWGTFVWRHVCAFRFIKLLFTLVIAVSLSNRVLSANILVVGRTLPL